MYQYFNKSNETELCASDLKLDKIQTLLSIDDHNYGLYIYDKYS